MEPRFEIRLFALLLVQGLNTNGVLFNRKLTGVEFSPYVWEGMKNFTGFPYHKTTENVETMLRVVSRKFSRVIIIDVDSPDLPYKERYSYYRSAGVKAKTAEIAAHINRQKQNLSLTVAIGIYNWDNEDNFNTEMSVALEASQIAQSNFHGTVEGILIWGSNSLADLNSTKKLLTSLKTLRERSLNLGMRVGLQQHNCERHFGQSRSGAESDDRWTLKRQLLGHVDFIICNIIGTSRDHLAERVGATVAANAVHSRMLTLRDDINSIDKNVEVMLFTKWIRQHGERLRNNVTKHISDLRDYWIHMDTFATQYHYAVWMYQAIGDWGWWKLRQNHILNKVSGYMEYVSALPDYLEDETDENNVFTEEGEVKKTTEEHNHALWKYVAIIIGAVLAVTFLSGLAYGIHRKRSMSRFRILTRQEVEEFTNGISENGYLETGDVSFVSETALKQPYDRSLEIPKTSLEILTNQPLGGGEFGCVFKALLRDESDYQREIALKTTKPNAGATAVKGFLTEIKILAYLGKHPNIVPILGAYTAEMYKGTVYIATELCPLGSLKTCLKNCQDRIKSRDISSVPYNDMIRWSNEIAFGMEYLEQKGVIHADLATRNVLCSSESTAKITDFGLSRRLYEYTNYTKRSQEPLPWRWMAFESLKSMQFSTKSDVWSYGVTLWEIFSLGDHPYPGLAWTLDFVEVLENGFRLKCPKYSTPEIFEIMEKCWNLQSDERPSFTELKNLTRELQTKAIDVLYTKLRVSDCAECTTAKETTSSVSSMKV